MRHVAIYGDVNILRDRCPDCKRMALILAGKYACCDRVAADKEARAYKRMSSGHGFRYSRVSKQCREEILKIQNNCCLYCDREFGVSHDGAAPLSISWDHFVPFSYLQCHPIWNFVAACKSCNSIKSSMMFQTIEEAILYVQARKKELQKSRVSKAVR